MKITRTGILLATLTLTAGAQTPGIEEAKRAINQRLLKIWKDIGTKGTRTVVFQDVVPGRGTPGHYPFRATLLVHDQETGYPPNRYYGKTCVGRLEQEVYTLAQDDFGGWDAQGKMTPDLNSKQCQNNTAEGMAKIPLSSLQGTLAPVAGGAPARSQVVPLPPQQQQLQKQPGAANVVAPGSYQCWANGQARPLLNFTSSGNGQYTGVDGLPGTMNVDGNGRVAFRGGSLDGFLLAGYYAVYYAPQGRPTVSFRNSGGSEIQYCQRR